MLGMQTYAAAEIGSMENVLYRIYGREYLGMTKRLLAASPLLTLLSEKEKEKSTRECAGEQSGKAMPDRRLRILIKPNLVTPQPADFGGTTHPEIVSGIIEYLQENGYDDITVAEGSWAGDSTEEAAEYCGFYALCEKYGVPFIDTKKMPAVEVDTGRSVSAAANGGGDAAGLRLHVCAFLKDYDFLINVPVLKGHCQTRMTCALKNMKGLIPDSEKRRFHTLGLHRPIAHLNTVIRQDFIVIDHICGDPSFEEGGDPLVRNCIMAATDPVLCDSYACRILGLSAEDVPYVGLAETLSVGTASLEKLKVITVEDPCGDAERDVPEGLSRALEVSYAVEDADSCSDCYAALTGALVRLREEGLLQKFTDAGGKICIGQGWRGISGADGKLRVGIGDCCAGFACHVPGCPADEDEIYRALSDLISP